MGVKIYADVVPFHGKNIARILNYEYIENINQVNPDDTIIIIGIYTPAMRAIEHIINRARKVICHWIGTDIWEAMNGNYVSPLLRSNKVTHLTEDERLQDELQRATSLQSFILPDVPQRLFTYTPLPKEFAVGVYMYNSRLDYYRNELMLQVAEYFSNTKFYFYGAPEEEGKKEKNVEWLGFVPIEEVINKVNGIMRFPIHDGLPFGPIEMISAGRWVVQEISMRGMYKCAPKLMDIVDAIKRTQKATKNGYYNSKKWKSEGEWYRDEFSHERYRVRMQRIIK